MSYCAKIEHRCVVVNGKEYRADRYDWGGSAEYRVWEPAAHDPKYGYTHTTITYDDAGKLWGDVQTANLPEWMESLKPFSEERSETVHAWFRAMAFEAAQVVREAYPGVAICLRSDRVTEVR